MRDRARGLRHLVCDEKRGRGVRGDDGRGVRAVSWGRAHARVDGREYGRGCEEGGRYCDGYWGGEPRRVRRRASAHSAGEQSC